MAEWSKNKVYSSSINGGKEFTTDDNLAVNELNAMVNNSFYAVDFAEAMADAPDISGIDGDGTPSVSLVSNGKFKKFKFSNLKGAKGEQGIQGAKGEKGDKGDTVPNTLTIGNVSSGETPSATITGTAPNQVLNLVLPKGEKGDNASGGLTLMKESITTFAGLSRIKELFNEYKIIYVVVNPTTSVVSTTNRNIDIISKTVTEPGSRYMLSGLNVGRFVVIDNTYKIDFGTTQAEPRTTGDYKGFYLSGSYYYQRNSTAWIEGYTSATLSTDSEIANLNMEVWYYA